MADEQPYNSLGQIIAGGGEIALGLAIAGGWSTGQIALLFARRFEPMRPEDRDRLMQLANAAVQAGKAITNSPLDQDIPLDQIPINPDLYGDDPAGRRIKWVGELLDENGKPIWQGRFDIPAGTSGENIMQQIRDEGRTIIGKYRERFGLEPDQEVPMYIPRVALAERQY